MKVFRFDIRRSPGVTVKNSVGDSVFFEYGIAETDDAVAANRLAAMPEVLELDCAIGGDAADAARAMVEDAGVSPDDVKEAVSATRRRGRRRQETDAAEVSAVEQSIAASGAPTALTAGQVLTASALLSTGTWLVDG